jgi:hypothetical protein
MVGIKVLLPVNISCSREEPGSLQPVQRFRAAVGMGEGNLRPVPQYCRKDGQERRPVYGSGASPHSSRTSASTFFTRGGCTNAVRSASA